MSVYFITCRELGVVKIGHARNPYARLNNIRVACPVEVELELFLEGGADEEKALHRHLSDYRVRGEWFLITPEIENLIANPPSRWAEPDAPRDPHEHLERVEADGWLDSRRVADNVGHWQQLTRARIMERKRLRAKVDA